MKIINCSSIAELVECCYHLTIMGTAFVARTHNLTIEITGY